MKQKVKNTLFILYAVYLAPLCIITSILTIVKKRESIRNKKVFLAGFILSIVITAGIILLAISSGSHTDFPDKSTEENFYNYLETNDFKKAYDLIELVEPDHAKKIYMKKVVDKEVLGIFELSSWYEENISGYYYFRKWRGDDIEFASDEQVVGMLIKVDSQNILKFEPLQYISSIEAIPVKNSSYTFSLESPYFMLTNIEKEGLIIKFEYEDAEFKGVISYADGSSQNVILTKVEDQKNIKFINGNETDEESTSSEDTNTQNKSEPFNFKYGTVDMSFFGYSMSHLYDFRFKFSGGKLTSITRKSNYDGKMYDENFKIDKNFTVSETSEFYNITLWYDNNRKKSVGSLRINRSGMIYLKDGNQWRKAQINKGEIEYK